MTRPRKRSVSDIYHVMIRGVNKQLIFEDDQDHHVYLKYLHENMGASVELLAFCLMGNHVHLLLHADIYDLSRFMQTTNHLYAIYYNRKYDRVGHLFQDRFQSEPINSDGYLIRVICYIHNNPNKAGIGKMDTYRWSSFREYLGAPGFCNTSYAMKYFKNEQNYIEMHRAYSDENGPNSIELEKMERSKWSDKHAIEILKEMLEEFGTAGTHGLSKDKRDEVICAMRRRGMSERQISRLTGVGRRIIHNVVKRETEPMSQGQWSRPE